MKSLVGLFLVLVSNASAFADCEKMEGTQYVSASNGTTTYVSTHHYWTEENCLYQVDTVNRTKTTIFVSPKRFDSMEISDDQKVIYIEQEGVIQALEVQTKKVTQLLNGQYTLLGKYGQSLLVSPANTSTVLKFDPVSKSLQTLFTKEETCGELWLDNLASSGDDFYFECVNETVAHQEYEDGKGHVWVFNPVKIKTRNLQTRITKDLTVIGEEKVFHAPINDYSDLKIANGALYYFGTGGRALKKIDVKSGKFDEVSLAAGQGWSPGASSITDSRENILIFGYGNQIRTIDSKTGEIQKGLIQ